MPLDDISISPQQQAATQQIAQNVADSSGSAPPSKPSTLGNIAGYAGNILLNAVNGFAQARMGQDAVGQHLRAKYQQELQDRELANKEKIGREQVQQQLLLDTLNNQGSAALQNPKIRKMIGIDNLPAYEAYGKSVDAQKQSVQQALVAMHLDPSLASLPKEAMQLITENQKAASAQKLAGINQQTAQIRQNTAAAEGAVSLRRAQLGLDKAQVELNKALQDKSDKAAEKQQDALGKWIDGLGKQRDALVAKYSGANTDGTPKFTDKQRAAAAASFNASVDAQAKRLKKAGMTDFDPEAYKVHADPSVPGSLWQWRKAEPGTLTANVPDTASPAPGTSATPTGSGAASASINPNAVVKSKSGRPMKKGADGKWYYADSGS